MYDSKDLDEGPNRPGIPAKPKRLYPRISSLGRVFASLGDGREGSVLNLSLGGILLRLKWLLNPGSSYFLKLFLDDQVAVVEARVVRLVTRKADYLAGMEFIRVSSRDRQILQTFVGPNADGP